VEKDNDLPFWKKRRGLGPPPERVTSKKGGKDKAEIHNNECYASDARKALRAERFRGEPESGRATSIL